MSEISRRLLLAGAASAPLLAQQAGRTAAAPAPARDTIPKRRLLSGRSTAESLQKSLVDPQRAAGSRRQRHRGDRPLRAARRAGKDRDEPDDALHGAGGRRPRSEEHTSE